MWRLAFVRPFEDPGFGPDATGVMMKDADGSQTELIVFATSEEAIGHLNSVGYEPMSAAINNKTNRWSMFWRRAEYITPVDEREAVEEDRVEFVPDVIPDPEPDNEEPAEAPKKRGRPKKEAVAAAIV